MIALLPGTAALAIAAALGASELRNVSDSIHDVNNGRVDVAAVAAIEAMAAEHHEFLEFVGLPYSERIKRSETLTEAADALERLRRTARRLDGDNSALLENLDEIIDLHRAIGSRLVLSPTLNGATIEALDNLVVRLVSMVVADEPHGSAVDVLNTHTRLVASLRLWRPYLVETEAIAAYLSQPTPQHFAVAASRTKDFASFVRITVPSAELEPSLGLRGDSAVAFRHVYDHINANSVVSLDEVAADWPKVEDARRERLSQIVSDYAAAYQQAIGSASDTARATSIGLLVGLGILAIATWGITIGVTRSIRKRVKALEDGATDIIAGRFSVGGPTDPVDELDGVAVAFNAVAVHIDRFRAESERLSIALLAGQPGARADITPFQGEWGRLVTGLNRVMERHGEVLGSIRVEASQRQVLSDIARAALDNESLTRIIEMSGEAVLNGAGCLALELWEVVDDAAVALRWSLQAQDFEGDRPRRVVIADFDEFDPLAVIPLAGCTEAIAAQIRGRAGPVGFVIAWEPDDAVHPARFVQQVGQLYSTIAMREEADRQANYNRLHDPTTGLPNSLSIESILTTALEARGEKEVTLVVFLTEFSDEYQPQPGRLAALGTIAARLRSRCDPTWTVGLGGANHITLIVPGSLDVASLATEWPRASAPAVLVDGAPVQLWVGVASTADLADPTVTGLLVAALQAARSAQTKRLQVVRYDPEFGEEMTRTQRVRRQLEIDIARGLAAPITVAFQPIVSINQRAVCGFEALARWHPTDLGPQRPDQFITMAEDMGQISELGLLLARRAMRDKLWLNRSDLSLAINVSAMDMVKSGHAERLLAIAHEEGVDPTTLRIELTETAMIDGLAEPIRREMHVLRSAGCLISIDDFGTGHASYAYLTDFPVNKVKIDRSFITNIHLRPEAKTVVHSIVELAHQLDLVVVAEGVETVDELRQVIALGCDLVQGYIFCPPRRPGEVTAALAALETQIPRLIDEASATLTPA
jgi:predicted signal transduction protein with EAL and GGDEF domain